MQEEIRWPARCDSCGTWYEGPDEEDVFTTERGYFSRYDYAYTCIKCVEPPIFKNSRILKRHVAKMNHDRPHMALLGYGFKEYGL